MQFSPRTTPTAQFYDKEYIPVFGIHYYCMLNTLDKY